MVNEEVSGEIKKCLSKKQAADAIETIEVIEAIGSIEIDWRRTDTGIGPYLLSLNSYLLSLNSHLSTLVILCLFIVGSFRVQCYVGVLFVVCPLP